MANPDPKVVLQAHALRTRVTRHALLYGRGAPRARHGGVRTLLGSAAVAAAIVLVVLAVVRVTAALHLR